MQLKIKKLHPNAIMPTFGTEAAASTILPCATGKGNGLRDFPYTFPYTAQRHESPKLTLGAFSSRGENAQRSAASASLSTASL